MMDFSSGHATQLGLALIFGIVLFVLVYGLSERKILGLLIIMIPFQLVSSRYGSLNMVLTYLIGFSLYIKGNIRYLPLFPIIVAIVLATFVSTFQALRPTWMDHLIYIISMLSNFVLFYLVYNFFRKEGDLRFAFKLLLWMNVLVVLYGVIQLVVGADKLLFFGIEELSFASNLTEKQRLVGTFGAPGFNAEYFALQILVLGYMFMNDKDKKTKLLVLGMILANFALLVATGSRGSFLVLIGGIVLFLWLYRRQLGTLALIRIIGIGGVLFTLMAVVIINYTDFNVLFKRLGDTEFSESGVPDTREQAFDLALERIPDAMIVGHGPRLRLFDEANRIIIDYESMPAYPHNLYLFLLYTLGSLGLFLYMVFFVSMYLRFRRARNREIDDIYLKGIPALGMLLLIVFLVDQLKIEFLRFGSGDTQHYMFTLWAILLAFTDIGKDKITKNTALDESGEKAPSFPQLLK